MKVFRRFPAAVLFLVFVALFTSDRCSAIGIRGRRSDDPNVLQPVVEQLSQKMEAVEATLKTLQHRLDDAQTSIGFYVRLKNHEVGGLSKHQTLKFDDVHFNAGNGYDVNTGIFSAPLPGTYVIFLEVMGEGVVDPYIYLHIMKNAQVLGGAHAGHSPYDNGSNMILVKLAKGDNIFVDVEAGTSLTGSEYTNFAGFRLSSN